MLYLHVVSVFSIKTCWPDSFASLRMFSVPSMFQGAKGWIHGEIFQKPEICSAGSAGLCAGFWVSAIPCCLLGSELM